MLRSPRNLSPRARRPLIPCAATDLSGPLRRRAVVRAQAPEGHSAASARKCLHWLPLLALLLLAGCARGAGESQSQGRSSTSELTPTVHPTVTALLELLTPTPVSVDLAVTEEDLSVEPLPIRAGFPFTVTAVIHNLSSIPAVEVPVLVYISAKQPEIGYVSFVQTRTVTVPISQSVTVNLPVQWNFAGGEHQVTVQVNRLPAAWQSRIAVEREQNTGDNVAQVELMVDPFDAYTSNLCPGRVDVEIGPEDVLPEPDQRRVVVRVHNSGNRAAYHMPVVVMGQELTGIAYTSAIAPCGGTVDLGVPVDRALKQGESLTVQVNPQDWAGGLVEDDFGNNRVSVAVGLPPGMAVPPGSGLDEYDFRISDSEIEMPQPWLALVTVHNLGTRAAAMVPIRVENEAGREITDAIPLVQGSGLGVAAIRIGYVWTRGGTLTFTVNPEGAKGAYPEANRDNNAAQIKLP